MATSTLRAIADHLVRFFEPLRDAVENVDTFVDFLQRLGWQSSNLPTSFGALAGSINTAIGAVTALADDATPDEVFDALKALNQVQHDLSEAEVPSGLQATAEEIAKAIVELLTVDYLSTNVPRLYQLFRAIGVLKIEEQEETPTRAAYVRTKVEWGRFADVIGDPRKITSELYGWGTANFDFTLLADHLLELLAALGRQPRFEHTTSVERKGYETNPTTAADAIDRMLVVPLAYVTVGDIAAEASLGLLELPAQPSLLPGLIVQLVIPDIPNEIAITASLKVKASADPSLTGPAGLLIRPQQPITFRSPLGGGSTIALPNLAPTLIFAPAEPVLLLGRPNDSRLELAGLSLTVGISAGEVKLDLKVSGLKLIVAMGEADGMVGSVAGSNNLAIDVNAGLRWSSKTGLSFADQSSLRLNLPIQRTIGPVRLDTLEIAIVPRKGTEGQSGFDIPIALSFGVQLGPVSISVTSIGVRLSFQDEPGNAGPFDVDAGFKPPNGLGISIKAGPVSGGGFILFDPPAGRYFGALELSVYGVAVKAFGLIETKFPDGHRGFSFLIIISAEFTPIQLGFGFTLNGVGGMAGINRTIDTDALLATVRRGTLDHVLFPKDPVKDAPSIVQELGAIFPAASGHYVFGPLAKIGWGTPTLVEARIGLVIEFPGPRLVVLGTVRAALPKPEAPLVLLNLDVAGVLDFPKKYFSLDASLHDSNVGGFPITGDMAMRLTWGNNPNFAFAIGGFNPHFTPPANFPKLRPATVDLGVHGNPSITLSGYLALTSNTAQTGAKLEARVSKGGANLYGFLGFDAIFVFSPFSFMGDVEGAVDVNFHGYGFSLHFHGHVQGPTPWKLDGQVCVSILFWDACVGFSVTLGGEQRVSLPGLDPWFGSPAGERSLAKQEVPGLSQALETTANWTGGLPTGLFAVATLIEAPPGAQTPVDPLGSATFRQKAVPLEIDVTRFAGTKPSVARNFKADTVTIGQAGQGAVTTITITDANRVRDFFAPAQYIEMKDAEKLSLPSFDLMHAGFTVSSDTIVSGTVVIHPFKYDTVLFSATAAPQTSDKQYDPSNTHVAAVAGRSAAAFGGIRLTGLSRFIDLPFFAKARLVNESYGVTDISTLGGVSGFPLGVSKSAAFSALFAANATNPNATKTFQITPTFNFRPA